jgi:diaminopimelate epimerase
MFFKQNIEIVIANPAGNITAFVENAENLNNSERAQIAKKILNEKSLNVEQVGFVIKPNTDNPLWHLEMAGGEFCGNAARAFGLFAAVANTAAANNGEKGQIKVAVSGQRVTVDYCISNDAPRGEKISGELHGSATVKMPLPLSREAIIYKNTELPLYIFEGISHVIARGIEASNETFFEIKKIVDERATTSHKPDALGVMFHDGEIMRPVVYVYSIDSLCHESSCGSGSAAFAIDHFIDDKKIEGRLEIKQGGAQQHCAQQYHNIIETVVKKDGELVSVTIGGAVTLLPRIPLP